MPRASRAAWKAARERWERDETVTHEQLAAELGVHRVSVTQKAGRDGWRRSAVPETLAQVVATIAETPLPVLMETDILSLSIVERVRVLNVQRDVMKQWREKFTVEAMAADDKVARRAQAVAQALAAAAQCENDAWGLQGWSDGLPTLAQEAQMQAAPAMPDWIDEEQRLNFKERGPSVEALEALDAPTPPPPPEKAPTELPPQLRAAPAPSPFPASYPFPRPQPPQPQFWDRPGVPASGPVRDVRPSS
jgi:hypothetical protein